MGRRSVSLYLLVAYSIREEMARSLLAPSLGAFRECREEFLDRNPSYFFLANANRSAAPAAIPATANPVRFMDF